MRIDATLPTRPRNVEHPDAPGLRASNATFGDALAAAREPAPAAPRTTAPSRFGLADAEAFAVFAEANRRAESGGFPTFSTLRTTAGVTHRASYGVAQLSIREHLARLARERDARLVELGTSRGEVDAMRARGDAAAAYYHLVVDGRDVGASATTLGLDAEGAERIAVLARSGDVEALRTLVGPAFATRTGLPASSLDAMMATRALLAPGVRDAFHAQYCRDHGAAFDPTHRDGARMAESARHLALAHPEVERALAILGGDESAARSLAHYLGVGDGAENLLGWHARAASTACPAGRFERLLASVDATTSRAREIEDFERALAAVARVSDLPEDARVATLARIGRIFHGAPARARETLFVDGRLDAPRAHSRAELDSLLDGMRSGRTWSDERLAARVAEVVAERRAT